MKTLALGLVLLVPASAFAQQPPPPPQPVIVTSGEGVVKKAPDRAFVTIAAESRARTAAEAQRLNTDAMAAVLDKIKAAGIPAEAIQTTGYNLQPEFDYANGRQTLREYLARNQVQVRVDTLSKTGDVIAAAVATGATNVSNIQFDLKDRDAIEREALRAAVSDARRRAEAAAAGAGVQLGGIVRIDEQRETPMPVRPMVMARVAGGGVAPSAVPVEAGEIEVRAHVTLTTAIR